MQIKTQRLKIRTLQNSDLNDVFDIYKNEETCKYLLHNAWNEKNKNEEFKEKLSKQSLEKDFAINLACILDDVVIGEINIWNTQMKDCVEIGIAFNGILKFYKIIVQNNPIFPAKYANSSMPLSIIFHKGEIVRDPRILDGSSQWTGNAANLQYYLQWINTVLNVINERF
jgi:hypothetical protein